MKAKSAMSEFYTRASANEGKKVFLSKPDGTPTKYYLIVRSQWSDAFQAAKARAMQTVARLVAGQEISPQDAADAQTLECAVALIAGWNLPDEFTVDNVREFLREAPQIRQRVDKIAGSDKSFFSSDSTPS